MTDCYSLTPGSAPLLISIPHAGTRLTESIGAALTDQALRLPDIDWFVERLYVFAPAMGIGVIQAHYARYVIDLNRPPDDAPLYPGWAGTGLCPTTLFNGDAVYKPGFAPNGDEIAARRRSYWQPYHDALRLELDRLRAHHGQVLLWDAHSIRSHVPRLFDGTLPDLNFGTGGGSSCDPAVVAKIIKRAGDFNRFSMVLNGRFKGGHITRHYGTPGNGIHALQLEISQSAYMLEEPMDGRAVYDPHRAAPLIEALHALMETALAALR